MKWLAIFLALVPFTTASPFAAWGDVGSYSPRPSYGLWGYPSHQRQIAHQVAHAVTEEALHDQIAHTEGAISSLYRQLQQHPFWTAGYPYGSARPDYYATGFSTPFYHRAGIGAPTVYPYEAATHKIFPHAAADALHHLEEDVHHQANKFLGAGGAYGYPRDSEVHHLHDTVAAGVEAEVATGDVHAQGAAHGVYVPVVSGLHAGVFQAKLRKLIDEHNEEEIQNQISHHHHWAQQLHHQQEFVNQQKHQIEAERSIVAGHPDEVARFDQAHHDLQAQEYHLIKEELAHHLAILQLQKALVHKERDVLEDAVAEHVREKAAHEWPTHRPFWHPGFSY